METESAPQRNGLRIPQGSDYAERMRKYVTHFSPRLFWVRSKVESENIKCKIIRQQQGEAAWGTSGQVDTD